MDTTLPIDAILTDDREGSRDLHPGLLSLSLPSSLCRLDYGDLCFEGSGPRGICQIGLEYKSLRDFLHSLRSGRLMGHQLPGMGRLYDYSYLLVEGAFRENPDNGLAETPAKGGWRDVMVGGTRFSYREIMGAAFTIGTIAGVPVYFTGRYPDTLSLIRCLYHWWRKPYCKHSTHKAIYTPPPKTALLYQPSLLRRIANQLPGIGWEKSGLVEARFRTVERMFQATRRDWESIDGIGPKLSAKIHAALHTGDPGAGE